MLFRDLKGDLAPDLYICNDFVFWPDRIWLNGGSIRFRAAPPTTVRNMAVSAMGGDVADINRDGVNDLFVTDMVSRQHAWRQRQRPNLMQGILVTNLEQPELVPEIARNVLQLNRGDGTYAEIAQLAGVDFTEWSWGAVFLEAGHGVGRPGPGRGPRCGGEPAQRCGGRVPERLPGAPPGRAVDRNEAQYTRCWRPHPHPLLLYHADFDEDGVVELIEAYFDPALGHYAPWRAYEVLARAAPFIVERAPTYQAYSEMSVEQLLGEHLEAVRTTEARTLDSILLLNRGVAFEVRALPTEAQLAPVFGVCVTDFDGDGLDDLFLAQNFFGVEPETSRYDAGRGLVLRGDGEGGFDPLSGAHSGITIYGEQRAAAAGDFGRFRLAVAGQRGADPGRPARHDTYLGALARGAGKRVSLAGGSLRGPCAAGRGDFCSMTRGLCPMATVNVA